MVRFAVAIPTYQPHFDALTHLLQRIATEQTCQPDIVAVSASSCVTAEDKEKLAALQSEFWPFQLLLKITSDPKNASENRNIAVGLAKSKGAEIISFFDADDVMHPRRCEYLKAAFEKNPGVDWIMHGRVHSDWDVAWPPPLPPKEEVKILKEGIYFTTETLVSPTGEEIVFQRAQFDIDEPILYCCGHISVRSHCFDNVLMNPLITGYEDSLFQSDLLRANYPYGLLPLNLSVYVMRHA